MFSKFTERMRRALGFARAEAANRGESHIGTDHILWSMLMERSSGAAEVLSELQVSVPLILLNLERQFPKRINGAKLGSGLPFTPRVKSVIDFATNFSDDIKCSYVGSEHFLVAISQLEGGSGHASLKTALDMAGVTPVKLYNLVDKNTRPKNPINIPKLIDVSLERPAGEKLAGEKLEEGKQYKVIDGKLEELSSLVISYGGQELHLKVIEKYSEQFATEMEDLLFRYGIKKAND